MTALLSGQRALGERIGGRLGRTMAGIARRLDFRQDPPPLRIDVRLVAEIGSEVKLTAGRDELRMPPLEEWLDNHVITKIPGADHAGQ